MSSLESGGEGGVEYLLNNHLLYDKSLLCANYYEMPKRQWLQSLSLLRYAMLSLQSCPTLCDPIDGSPPGSPVPGILQARTLEWVAISFSNA